MKDPPCLTDNSPCTTTTAEHAGALLVGVRGEPDTATRSTGLGSGLRRCSRPIHLAGLDAVLARHESAKEAILRSRE